MSFLILYLHSTNARVEIRRRFYVICVGDRMSELVLSVWLIFALWWRDYLLDGTLRVYVDGGRILGSNIICDLLLVRFYSAPKIASFTQRRQSLVGVEHNSSRTLSLNFFEFIGLDLDWNHIEGACLVRLLHRAILGIFGRSTRRCCLIDFIRFGLGWSSGGGRFWPTFFLFHFASLFASFRHLSVFRIGLILFRLVDKFRFLDKFHRRDSIFIFNTLHIIPNWRGLFEHLQPTLALSVLISLSCLHFVDHNNHWFLISRLLLHNVSHSFRVNILINPL